ncbi:hypothetical protein [Paucibacter sp. Y2R2-4]|uniref:hypothetical protein n=1 Tax=Paucibacter sp. Y2R2-4 TaxID=2893553 RepID=UPI0021E4770C|nr:hypothetical protein [Paucibacter sp. Y2R2-4]MCV2349148.1 hypothetical protein [Paucibacter sp. Y2R2-4]
MSNDHQTLDTPAENEIDNEFLDEDSESIGDLHRIAAQHFSAAAEHHLAAAAADDEGDIESLARHAYLAYRHQLNAVQYAEIAALDNDALDTELVS